MHSQYESGKTLREVGEANGITRQRVLQLFKAYSLGTRKQTMSELRRQHFERVRRLNEEKRVLIPRDVLDRLARKQIPLKQVLTDFNCTYGCILRSRKHHGLTGQDRKKNPELTNELLRRLFLDDGLPSSEIARRYGYRPASIAIKLHRLGITRRSQREVRDEQQNNV